MRLHHRLYVGSALIGALSLAACSGGGGGSLTPQATTRANHQSQTTASRFLPGATQGAPNSSDFTYIANPPGHFAFTAAALPKVLPSPAQCVATYGFACYTPAEIRAAYDVPGSLTGAGQTIVIIDAYGSPTIRNDLHTFDVVMGLPDPTLNIIYPGGKPATQTARHGNPLGWAGEVSLDVEWSHAIAPAATIDLVVAASDNGDVLNLAEQYAIQHHLGNVMSLSFGAPEGAIAGRGNNLWLKQADANFQAATDKNITLIASSGDDGAIDYLSFVNASFPASDPLVTAVGGTNLFYDLTASGTAASGYQGETVWNDSPGQCPFGCSAGPFGATGGAPSVIFAAPAYQKALSGYTARTTSDVGYNASVYTGLLVYIGALSPAGFYFVGGTSEGAPQWAGIVALADESAGRALGLINPKLYAIGANAAEYAADFHDVTSGTNAFDGPGFPAKTGYDLPTGLGTPDVAHLINDLTH
jgi:subtilase family serine protease